MVRDELPTSPSGDQDVPWSDAAAAVDATAGQPAAAPQQAAIDPETDEDLVAASAAWEADEVAATADQADPAEPFVGRWNQLISTTNWEKGRIISQWRQAMIDAGASPGQYADETWAQRVGGVTGAHVGRLRRVHDRFGDSFQSYPGLYWSHFLAAIDWDDAPMWLEGAVQSRWSVSAMRHQRWQANGADETQRPAATPIVSTDLDEDVDPALATNAAGASPTQPGQGGGTTKQFGEGPEGVVAGPTNEGPDFGDEDPLNRTGVPLDPAAPNDGFHPHDPADQPTVQPFAGLPELPGDLAEAVELLKLAVLRHKAARWKETSAETVRNYLAAFNVLLNSPG